MRNNSIYRISFYPPYNDRSSGYVKENRHICVPVTSGYGRRQTGAENAPGFRPMRMIPDEMRISLHRNLSCIRY